MRAGETLYKRYDPIGGFKRSCIGGGARVTGTRRKTAFENGNSLSKWAARHSLAAPGGNPGEKRNPLIRYGRSGECKARRAAFRKAIHHRKAPPFRVCPRRERPLPFPPQGWEGRNTPAASPPRRWAEAWFRRIGAVFQEACQARRDGLPGMGAAEGNLFPRRLARMPPFML